MLQAFVQAFRTPDLRRKILFSLMIMALYRLGTFIPTPSVRTERERLSGSAGADLLA